MGWYSGTDIFDKVMDAMFEWSHINDMAKIHFYFF